MQACKHVYTYPTYLQGEDHGIKLGVNWPFKSVGVPSEIENVF